MLPLLAGCVVLRRFSHTLTASSSLLRSNGSTPASTFKASNLTVAGTPRHSGRPIRCTLQRFHTYPTAILMQHIPTVELHYFYTTSPYWLLRSFPSFPVSLEPTTLYVPSSLLLSHAQAKEKRCVYCNIKKKKKKKNGSVGRDLF